MEAPWPTVPRRVMHNYGATGSIIHTSHRDLQEFRVRGAPAAALSVQTVAGQEHGERQV